jgi:hypothetical protein
MASFTWTKEKCSSCGHTTKTRGEHKGDNLHCFYCRVGVMQWVEIHYGREKYAGLNAGKTIKRDKQEPIRVALPASTFADRLIRLDEEE